MPNRLVLAACASLAFACADPGPETGSFGAFVDSLEREADTGVYIVDGDLAVDSDKRLRDVYDAMREGGQPDLMAGSSVWGPERRHHLSYCVSDSLGERHGEVVAAMAEAAAAWEGVADVHFHHDANQDSSCNNNHRGVWFDVGGVEDVSYRARAFFPTASRVHRSVRLADAAFDGSLPLRAVLLHQLGHVLGLPNSGCEATGAMQSLECAGDDLEIDAADAGRVSTLYGASTHEPHVPSVEPIAAHTFRADGMIGAHHQRRVARVAVVPGSTFRATIAGTGDIDLYVGLGEAPGPDDYACRPYGPGSDEQCEIAVPDDVDSVFVMLAGRATHDTSALELSDYVIELDYLEPNMPQVVWLEQTVDPPGL